MLALSTLKQKGVKQETLGYRQIQLRAIHPCTNQQPPQRGGAVPDPDWVGSKRLLAFPKVSVNPALPFIFSVYSQSNSVPFSVHFEWV